MAFIESTSIAVAPGQVQPISALSEGATALAGGIGKPWVPTPIKHYASTPVESQPLFLIRLQNGTELIVTQDQPTSSDRDPG